MEATFIPGLEVNSDLGIVNSARVSLGKHHSEFQEKEDTKLIQYLAAHNHWTPFAHARLYFEINWSFYGELQQLHWYRNYNSAGFSHNECYGIDTIKGSLYSWICNRQYLPIAVQDEVQAWIVHNYPIAAQALRIESEPFRYLTHTAPLTEDYIACRASQEPKYWKLLTATLRVKVPIFVARQIRTSQVGFAYSDQYVESESFVFNEVSRRYVNDEPSFYEIKEWRVREGNKIKQGSTGVANAELQRDLLLEQANLWEEYLSINGNIGIYEQYSKEGVAPEQLRALLPQSMYTEFYMTGTLHRWAQFMVLRTNNEVQEETQEAVRLIFKALSAQYPAWVEYYRNLSTTY